MNVIPLCKICPSKERKGFFTKLRKGEPPPVPHALYKKTVSPIALSRLFLGIRIDLIFGNESEYLNRGPLGPETSVLTFELHCCSKDPIRRAFKCSSHCCGLKIVFSFVVLR